jgi:hypothetical protein
MWRIPDTSILSEKEQFPLEDATAIYIAAQSRFGF